MHLVYFQGGLANQLFQLALYFKLIELYGSANVFVDIRFYKTNKEHGGFQLNRFLRLNYYRKKYVPYEFHEINESNFFSASFSDEKNFLYVGYWQDEVFFPKDLTPIREIFQGIRLNNTNQKFMQKIKESESVSIHVRRGDYVDHFLHGNIANEVYLENAIHYFEEKLTNPVFFVFSDEIEWCKENLKIANRKFFFISNEKMELDLFLMSNCKYNVIANSSFSWWAQRLNEHAEKIVVAPEYWFNEEVIGNRLNLEQFVHIKNYKCIKEVKTSPYFSILIPVFNRQFILKRCLTSVLNQTYENIEIIVVDDCSQDQSYDILKNYACNDARIKLIRLEKNSSLLSARLAAMRIAKGKYVIFLDSDDYLELSACEKIKERILREKVDVLGFSYQREPMKKLHHSNECFGMDTLEKVLKREYSHTLWNKAYSLEVTKKVLENADDFYCNMSEDVYFTALYMFYSKDYAKVDEVLYHYVVGNGISTTKELSRSDLGNMIGSTLTKDKHLYNFLEKNARDLASLIEIGSKNDFDYLATMCRKSYNSLHEKMELLHMLDSIKKSNYLKQYEDEIEGIIQKYNEYARLNFRQKVHYLLKKGMGKFWRKVRKLCNPFHSY